MSAFYAKLHNKVQWGSLNQRNDDELHLEHAFILIE